MHCIPSTNPWLTKSVAPTWAGVCPASVTGWRHWGSTPAAASPSDLPAHAAGPTYDKPTGPESHPSRPPGSDPSPLCSYPTSAPASRWGRTHLWNARSEERRTRKKNETNENKIDLTQSHLISSIYQFVNLQGSSGIFRLQVGEGSLEGVTLRLAPCILRRTEQVETHKDDEDNPCSFIHSGVSLSLCEDCQE